MNHMPFVYAGFALYLVAHVIQRRAGFDSPSMLALLALVVAFALFGVGCYLRVTS